MSFVSFFYPIFLVLVSLVYFLLDQRYRWIWLLAVSLYFYSCWKIEFLPLMLLCILANYLCSRAIAHNQSKFMKRVFLILAVLLSLLPLFIFKYYNFFVDSCVGLGLRKIENLILPVGISFYTFQALSYTFDVYFNKIKVEKRLGIYALFVSFFPQLVAGPIERSTHLIPQLETKHYFDWERFKSGTALLIWGFFKKIVIADYLSVFVNSFYEHPHDQPALHAILATYFFAFQIYCDFSGYTDIALGSARIMGFDLSQNFLNPYFSKSFKEFWQRWHITLMTWFKDYLYIPLGGSRAGVLRWVLNISLVFFLSGLWHGANWTYVCWGLVHGLLYICSELLNRIGPLRQVSNRFFDRIPSSIKILFTFTVVVIVWVLFRAQTIKDACDIYGLVLGTKWEQYLIDGQNLVTNISKAYLVNNINLGLAFILIGILLLADYLRVRLTLMRQTDLVSKLISNVLISLMLIMILLFTQYTTEDFIYFQF